MRVCTTCAYDVVTAAARGRARRTGPMEPAILFALILLALFIVFPIYVLSRLSELTYEVNRLKRQVAEQVGARATLPPPKSPSDAPLADSPIQRAKEKPVTLQGLALANE